MAKFCEKCGKKFDDNNLSGLCSCENMQEEKVDNILKTDDMTIEELEALEKLKENKRAEELKKEEEIKKAQELLKSAGIKTVKENDFINNLKQIDYQKHAVNTVDELKNTAVNFKNDPLSVAKNPKRISLLTAGVILFVQVLSFLFLAIIVVYRSGLGKFLKETRLAFKEMDEYSLKELSKLNIGVPSSFQIIFMAFLLAILQIALLFACIYLLGKLFKNNMTIHEIISLLAISSIPLSISIVMICVLVLIFNVFMSLFLAIYIFLLAFSTIASLLILNTGIKEFVDADLKRTIFISSFYSVQLFIISFILISQVQSFIEKILVLVQTGNMF